MLMQMQVVPKTKKMEMLFFNSEWFEKTETITHVDVFVNIGLKIDGGAFSRNNKKTEDMGGIEKHKHLGKRPKKFWK